MPARLVQHFSIATRRGGPLGIVAPDDFELTLRATSASPVLPPGALAYCADIARERVLFTCHAAADVPAVFGGTFLFVDQLRLAGGVVSVPFERLAELGLAQGQAEPVLIFSAGRAGSTLLAKLLGGVGLPCASEPDMLTQMVCLPEEARRGLPPGMDIEMAGICMAALARVLGRGAFLKLRSQCNAAPLLLLGGAASGRVVFLLRQARVWALSRRRAFAEGPAHIANILRETMEALDTVLRAGVPCDVVWFETVLRDPLAALRICAPGARPDPARVASVMARDAQDGTILARENLAESEVEEGFLAAFEAAWAGAQATAAWGEQTWAYVHEMWRA
jgi:hypothetical protein